MPPIYRPTRKPILHNVFSRSLSSVLILLAIAAAPVLAQPEDGWVSFGGDPLYKGSAGSYMKDESTTGMLVNFDVSGMNVHSVEVAGEVYQRLSIPGNGAGLEIGEPEVPVLGQVVEIPFGVDVDVEIYKAEYETLEGYRVYPTQIPPIRADSVEGEFLLDAAVYGMDAFYPARNAEVLDENIGIVRGHRVLFLKVYPVQFNPVSGELRVYSQLEVRLNYDRPGQIRRVPRRLQSRPFEEVLEASVLNYKAPEIFGSWDWDAMPDYWLYQTVESPTGYTTAGPRPGPEPEGEGRDDGSERNGGFGCDYLIVTTDEFFDETDANTPVMRLREWKRRKGLRTQVVLLDDIPDDDSDGTIDEYDLQAYIQDAYDSWSPPPTYILLFGDTGDDLGNEIMPTFYETSHSYPPYSGADIGTDLYYVTTHGTDYFPDIFIGRISVDDAAQGDVVVDKIIDYESNPPLAAGFYTDVPLVCLFEDLNSDGQERGTFRIIEFSEEIWSYLDANGYNPERIYNQSGDDVDGPQEYEDGSDIPAGLTMAGGFDWDGDAGDISNAVNNGCFCVNYDGHGGRNGWSLPNYNSNDVDNLVNGNLTPVVFSFACETGWFDNETDDDALLSINNRDTDDDEECFTEHFLRNNNGGAVAILGSTRVSYDHNDFMMLGAFEAIWPDFFPQPSYNDPESGHVGQLPGVVSGPLLRMGQVNTFTKIYMANVYSDSDLRLFQFEMYHLLGDPEMPIWTENPTVLNVEHPDAVGSTGIQDFVVRVHAAGAPVASAVVCLMQDGEIVSIRHTDALGVARFTRGFSQGQLDITVTALNHRPYQGGITVTDGGALINRLNPDNGTNGQPFNVGGRYFSGSENIQIRLDGALMTTHAASGGEFGQSGVENVSITVPAGHDHGLFNITAEGSASGRAAVDVFQVRDENPVDLYTYCQWDNSTWFLNPGGGRTWNNPEIQLYDSNGNPVESNNLTVGHQYRIDAVIHNKANFPADNATVTFKEALYGSGQPVWTVIGTDNVDVPANGTAVAEMSWVPSPTGHLCIKVQIDHVEDENTDNNLGQENCDVSATSSPATVQLGAWNPTDQPGATYFEVRQLGGEVGSEPATLWETAVEHPDPQVIQPGESAEAAIVFDPDWTYVEPGTEAEFAVTGFINGQMVGGVNMRIIRSFRRILGSLHVGYASPVGTFSDYYDPGLGVFLDGGYRLRSNLALVGLLGYTSFPAKDGAAADVEDLYIINVNLNAQYRLNVRNRLASYYRAGVGYYYPEHGGNSYYGGNAGVGLLYYLSNRLALSLGADYHYVREGLDYSWIAPDDAGEDIQFLLSHLGVVIYF